MEGNGVRIGKIAAVLLVATLTIAGLVYIQPQNGEAMMSEDMDNGGYMWCDSASPDPKVIYEWIDAKANGAEFTELDTTSTVAYLPLLFTFPYYGEDFNELWVTPRGYLCFDEIDVPDTGYSSNLPNSNGQNGQIAAGWSSAYDYYTTGGVYGGVHYYFSPLNDFVCIEWNKNSMGQSFEIILYSSGLVKLQWKELGSSDNYKDGYYLVAGIESPDGSTGLCYSKYTQRNLFNSLAVEFSTNLTEIEDIALVNGDGDGHICFAEYDSYEFSALIGPRPEAPM
jgi:hypothetical protein